MFISSRRADGMDVSAAFQQAEQLKKSRKRPHPPSSLLLLVKRKDSLSPHPSLKEVEEVRQWLAERLEELEVRYVKQLLTLLTCLHITDPVYTRRIT